MDQVTFERLKSHFISIRLELGMRVHPIILGQYPDPPHYIAGLCGPKHRAAREPVPSAGLAPIGNSEDDQHHDAGEHVLEGLVELKYKVFGLHRTNHVSHITNED